jgi:hypothetical protein
MPFEEIETHTKHNAPPTALLSYMRSKARGKSAVAGNGKGQPKLTVTLPTTICGLSKKDHFKLFVGTHQDAGKIRIKAATGAGSIEPTEFKSHYIFRFGHVPSLGDEIFDGERPARKVSDDEYEIDVGSLFNDAVRVGITAVSGGGGRGGAPR